MIFKVVVVLIIAIDAGVGVQFRMPAALGTNTILIWGIFYGSTGVLVM